MFCLRKGIKDADKRRDLGGGRWGEAVSRSLLEKLCRGDLSKMLNQKSESMDFRHRPGKEGKEMGRGEQGRGGEGREGKGKEEKENDCTCCNACL